MISFLPYLSRFYSFMVRLPWLFRARTILAVSEGEAVAEVQTVETLSLVKAMTVGIVTLIAVSVVTFLFYESLRKYYTKHPI